MRQKDAWTDWLNEHIGLRFFVFPSYCFSLVFGPFGTPFLLSKSFIFDAASFSYLLFGLAFACVDFIPDNVGFLNQLQNSRAILVHKVPVWKVLLNIFNSQYIWSRGQFGEKSVW
jgi:hypothetical protein